jgi:hypothetical protein
MEQSYCNYTSDTVLLFSSETHRKRASIVQKSLPHVHRKLAEVRKHDIDSADYMNAYYEVMQYVKESLKLADYTYLCTLNSGECKAIHDDTVPRYFYTVSLIRPNKLTISTNSIDLGQETRFDSYDGKIIRSVKFNMVESGKTEYQAKLSKLFQSLTTLPGRSPDGSSLFYNDDINRPDDEFDILFNMKLDPNVSRELDIKISSLFDNTTKLLEQEVILSSIASQNDDDMNLNAAIIFIIVFALLILIVVIVAAIGMYMHHKRKMDNFMNN